MSVWGPSNFDRDDSLDVLGDLFDHILKTVREVFTFEAVETLYNDFGESDIVANIDIISTLIEHYQHYPNLETEEVIKWQREYLITFDRTINGYSESSEYIEERRRTIVKTFDKLIKQLKINDE